MADRDALGPRFPHETVLREQTVAALRPADGERFVDCTLGMGGHSEGLLEAAHCEVLGLDRDPAALQIATTRLGRFGERFRAIQGSFSDLLSVLDKVGWSGVHGVVADLGVSSLQLDTPERGFAFRFAGPIDMRMDPSAGRSASDLVHDATEAELASIIHRYGEERFSRRIARAIVQGRPWSDTAALAEAIAQAIPSHASPRGTRIHPATRTFQALRIAVNDELGELEKLLPAALDALLPDGRLAIISFHSLEDRIVKQFMARESGRGTPKDAFGNPIQPPRLAPRPSSLAPADDDPNPRARSARLRVAVRLP
jgi:16S rRNA (cytosine1402-N4)-methyltransferase